MHAVVAAGFELDCVVTSVAEDTMILQLPILYRGGEQDEEAALHAPANLWQVTRSFLSKLFADATWHVRFASTADGMHFCQAAVDRLLAAPSSSARLLLPEPEDLLEAAATAEAVPAVRWRNGKLNGEQRSAVSKFLGGQKFKLGVCVCMFHPYICET